MNELSNALQGKLNPNRKSHIKDLSERQLDLFSSLSDRSASGPKIVQSKPESKPESRPEPEPVLPPSPGTPPDVAADVRAELSESGQVRPFEAAAQSGAARPTLRTGVYQRPHHPVAPPPPRPPAPPPRQASGPRISPFQHIRDWFAGVEMDRRMVSLVAVLAVLVALIAFWTAGPRNGKGKPGTMVNLDEMQTAPEPASASPVPVPAVPSPAVAATVPAAPAVTGATDWKIPGTETVMNGGAYLVRFNDPVFVSADKISLEGWAALKAVAAKLVTLKAGARVIVTGYTDNEPLTKPTPQFQSNADIAAARAKVAVEHLTQFARASKGLTFEARTGEPSQAPYPNDTPQNRRLNRTATVQVIPAP